MVWASKSKISRVIILIPPSPGFLIAASNPDYSVVCKVFLNLCFHVFAYHLSGGKRNEIYWPGLWHTSHRHHGSQSHSSDDAVSLYISEATTLSTKEHRHIRWKSASSCAATGMAHNDVWTYVFHLCNTWLSMLRISHLCWEVDLI